MAGEAFRRVESAISFPLRVLLYHQVATPSFDPWGMAVGPSNFDEHLAALGAGGRLVTLDEELAVGAGKRPTRRSRRFAITFDDGYLDNLQVATPLLERHDAPATVFIASHFLDQPYFWWVRLAEVVLGVAETVGTVVAAEELGLLDAPGADALTEASPAAVHERLYRELAAYHPDARVGLLDELARVVSAGPPAAGARPLTSEELQRLAAHPLITIGAHSHTHPRLAAIPLEEARRDVVEGTRRLDELLGPSRRLFAYPHGSANHAVGELVERAGHAAAFTTVSRPVSMIDRTFLLPRIATQNVSGEEFSRRRGL